MGRYSRELAPAFADFVGVEAGQRVLDVGCGSGRPDRRARPPRRRRPRCGRRSLAAARRVCRAGAGLRPEARRRRGSAVARRFVRRGARPARRPLHEATRAPASPRWPASRAQAGSSRPAPGISRRDEAARHVLGVGEGARPRSRRERDERVRRGPARRALARGRARRRRGRRARRLPPVRGLRRASGTRSCSASAPPGSTWSSQPPERQWAIHAEYFTRLGEPVGSFERWTLEPGPFAAASPASGRASASTVPGASTRSRSAPVPISETGTSSSRSTNST